MADQPMFNKRIVWKNPDGSLAITCPVADSRCREESETAWLERVASLVKPHPLAIRLEDRSPDELPESRRFRNAWREAGGKPRVDMVLAREQRMGEIRQKRNNLLRESDGLLAVAREMDASRKVEGLLAIRQGLRDIPQKTNLEHLTTPEALENFEPDWPSG
ncbi:MAG: phage tail assembly chaperone [Deltaproteobacteria bacterium]|nr:phage tail assembly chaperone [Deltaproteobacteria bacterium]